MNEVYKDDFIKVYQSDEGDTYVAHVNDQYLVMRKHCIDFVAEVKIRQTSHDMALDFLERLSESTAEGLAALMQ